MKRLAALLVLPLLFAGCVSTDAGEPLSGASDEALQAGALTLPQTQLFAGNLKLAAGAANNYAFPTNSVEPIEFTATVPANATALVVELRWTNAANDLDVILYGPEDKRTFLDGGSPGAGDSPMKVVLAQGEFPTGDVLFRVVAKASVAESFELAVTPFEGIVPAEDFTGFAP